MKNWIFTAGSMNSRNWARPRIRLIMLAASLLPMSASAEEAAADALADQELLEFLGEWGGNKQQWLDPVLLEELQRRDKNDAAKEDQGNA